MNRKLLFILVSALVLCLDCSSQSTICSYSYRKRITFDPTKVAGSSDLTDFPVLIEISSDNNLRTTANSGHVRNSNGYDIIFTADDGVTVLNHELTDYSASTGALECWVKIPKLSISVKTHIYMYYGNSSATTDPSSSGTWSNGYVGVWHLDNSLNNSTSTSGLNGTNHSTSNTGTAMFNSARSFNGSSQYIDISSYNSAYDLTGGVCVSAWIRLSSTGSDQKILGNQDNSGGGWKFGVFSDNKIEFEIRNSGNSPFLSRSAGGGTALGTGTWNYVIGQYSNAGDFIDTYLNGNLDRSYSTTAVLGSSGGTMKFGREPFASGAFFDGRMDEIRLSNVVRSADWIATEYNNQNSPSTFYSISNEPVVFTGASNANWTTNGNWSSGSAPTASTDVILSSSSSQPNLNTDIQLRGLWVRPSTTLTIGNGRTLAILHDITNCGVIVGNNGNSEVLLNSSSAFAQTQYLSGSGDYNLRDLTINNTFSPNPSVVLNSAVGVANDLTLTSGVVSTTTANILSLGTGATSTSGSASSYVSGPMSKSGTAAFVFPVGKDGLWRRIGISAPSASSTFLAEYFNAAYTNTSTVNSPITDVSKIEYWQLDRTAGSGNARVSLYWESAAASGIDNCADLTVARFNGTGWDERAASAVTSSSCSGTGAGIVTTTAVVTAFSPFTFGSKSTGVNPLPVELIEFKAECDKNTKKLIWETASERNNDYFEIERSIDGNEWITISMIKSSGTNSTKKTYSYNDDLKTNDPVYYRLSQVDIGGKKTVFKNVFTECGSSENSMRLFPNPATDELNLDFQLDAPATGTLKILDNLGRTLVLETLNLKQGSSVSKQLLNLNAGSYTVLFQCQRFILSNKLLIVK